MKTHNKNGSVSAYGFACGYTETFENGDARVSLSEQHGVYHMKGFDQAGRFYHTYGTLAIARKFYAKKKRHIAN